jgi:hypothetical protein
MKPVVYLCTGQSCQPPTSDAAKVKEMLKSDNDGLDSCHSSPVTRHVSQIHTALSPRSSVRMR